MWPPETSYAADYASSTSCSMKSGPAVLTGAYVRLFRTIVQVRVACQTRSCLAPFCQTVFIQSTFYVFTFLQQLITIHPQRIVLQTTIEHIHLPSLDVRVGQDADPLSAHRERTALSGPAARNKRAPPYSIRKLLQLLPVLRAANLVRLVVLSLIPIFTIFVVSDSASLYSGWVGLSYTIALTVRNGFQVQFIWREVFKFSA